MKKIFLIVFLIPIIICGCQNDKEINNLAIVNKIGIDMENNKYKVTIQVIDINKSNNDSQENLSKPITYSALGNNISEALNNINLKSPKSLYLGHLELLIVSEEVAKNKMDKISDYFLRNSNVSKNFTMLVSKTKTEDILKVLENDSSFPTGNILGSVENSSNSDGTSSNIKFIKFMQDLLSEGKNPILKVISKNDKDKLTIDDIAIFKNKKLITFLDGKYNIAYNFITDNIKSTNINYKCSDKNYIGVNVTKSNTNIKSIIKNNEPIIYLDVDINAQIEEVNCSKEEDNISKIRSEVEKEVKKMIDDVIDETKKDINSDIFGFGENIYQNHLSFWKSIKNDWLDKYYPNLKVKTDVEVKLDNQGSILETVR